MIEIFIFSTLILFSVMSIAFLIYFILQRPGIVDVFWGAGILLVGFSLLYIYSVSFFHFLFISLVAIWGLRLSLFLFFTRIFKKERDRRYEQLIDKWGAKKHVHLLGNYYLQASLQLLLCSIYIPIFNHSHIDMNTYHWILTLLFFSFVIGESIADYQLYSFKQNSAKKDICCQGLWAYSRHPNYFFEILIWFCFAGFSFSMIDYYLAFIAPITILIILRYITGPYTERLSINKYGDLYRDYKRRVPMIFPNPLTFLRKKYL